jgi:FixJ family two-component response regulator
VTFLKRLLPSERRLLDKSLSEPSLAVVADELALSYDTVRTYRRRIMQQWRRSYPKAATGKKAFEKMLEKIRPYLAADVS